ncbi:MAG TPA: hypothetical protein VN646_02170 [Candidatus Acidoferrum sp.]|nr:hypothetical protein [Candidatus Acidoferrum sp.]
MTPVGLERGRELGAGRGLAGAVDAEHEDDARPSVEGQRLGRAERVEQEAAKHRSKLTGARDGAVHHLLAAAVDEVGGHDGAEIRRDEDLLELLPERLVDRPLRLQHRLQTRTEKFLGATQAISKLLADAGKELHPG